MDKHDCGPGGLRSCEDHPKVHLTLERSAPVQLWTIWRPGKRTGGVVSAASTGWTDHKLAMNFAKELAHWLASR